MISEVSFSDSADSYKHARKLILLFLFIPRLRERGKDLMDVNLFNDPWKRMNKPFQEVCHKSKYHKSSL